MTPLPLEREAIEERRNLYHIGGDAPVCGLALSGGGIRSATFSVGLLCGLSSLKLLQRIDYLSTVSGGGYAGAFYCGLFAPRGGDPAVVDPKPEEDLLAQADAQLALGYLRQSGRYLTPAGGRDYVYGVAMLIRNWLALALVVGVGIIFLELVLDGIRSQILPLIPDYAAHPWISPLLFAAPILLLGIVASGWAYWLTMSDVSNPTLRPPLIGTIVIVVAAVAIGLGYPPALQPNRPTRLIALIVAAAAILALIAWLVAIWLERGGGTGKGPNRMIMRQDRIRHRLSLWQASTLGWLIWVLVLALADSATFLLFGFGGLPSVKIASLAVTVVPAAQWLAKKLAMLPKFSAGGGVAKNGLGMIARFGTPLAWLAALLFTTAALAFWGGIAHDLAWQDRIAGGPKRLVMEPFYPTILAGAALFVVLAASTQSFLNLSSLASFYAERLCRAYLGAGNRKRIGADGDRGLADAKSVAESSSGDDLGLFDYYRGVRGAPVHLINVTINETRGKGPATVQRDRHGLNMVISPDGVSYSEVAIAPLTIKALGHEDMKHGNGKANAGQSLPLSTWIGISGAAFTTGLGSYTSLEKSVLSFLANVRLGYWWKADRTRLRVAPTYVNFFRELAASFPGTEKAQWYLSDGGHFENSGAYELIRREVPLIIVSDNGADPKYGFEDIANLVRKARIDFGAEIRFRSAAWLDDYFCADEVLRGLFAEPRQFADPDGPGMAVAMLAQVRYRGGEPGTLLVIKPRLSPDGPADLMRYKTDNADFPQQTTFDQFFDEAQWESYFELGRLIARRVFKQRETDDELWQPARMAPLAW